MIGPRRVDSRGLAGLDLGDDGRCRAGRDISTSDAGFVSIGSRYRSCEARQRALSHGFAGFRHRERRPGPGGEKHEPGFEMQGAGDRRLERRLRHQRVLQDGEETEGVQGGDGRAAQGTMAMSRSWQPSTS